MTEKYLLAKAGTRRVDKAAAQRGRLRFVGEYLQAGNGWGSDATARVFDKYEKELCDALGVPDSLGGEWLPIVVGDFGEMRLTS